MSKAEDVVTVVGVGCIGAVVFVLAYGVAIAGSIWEAWVITKLWDWFVVTQFGLASLTLPVAFGLNVLVTLFTFHYRDHKKEESGWGTILGIFGHCFVHPALALLLGYVTYTYFV